MTYAKALVDNARQRTLYLRIWPSPIFECALVLIAHISLGREPKPETLANVRFRAHNGLKSDIAPCPKSARTGHAVFAPPHPRDQGARIASRLVSKAPKEQLDVRKPSHLRSIGQHRSLVAPR
jgi:hypothetical protein